MRTPLLTAAAVLLLTLGARADVDAVPPAPGELPRAQYTVPPKPAPTILVYLTSWVELHGPGTADDVSHAYDGTRYTLPSAMLAAGPGDVVEFYGEHQALDLARSNPSYRRSAVRSAPFDGITLQGGDDTAILQGLYIGQSGGGTGDLVLRDFAIDAASSGGIVTDMGTVGRGTLHLYGMVFRRGVDHKKWDVRGHGLHGWEVLDCDFTGGSREWGLYLSSPQQAGAFIGGCRFADHGRGAVQLVSRGDNPRMPTGDLWLQNLRAWRCGWLDGGGAYSIAGAAPDAWVVVSNCAVFDGYGGGLVVFRDKKQWQLSGSPTTPINQRQVIGQGHVLGWPTDATPEELAVEPPGGGFAVHNMAVANFRYESDRADRQAVELSGIYRLELFDAPRRREQVGMLIDTPRKCIVLEYWPGQPVLHLDLFGRTSPSTWALYGYRKWVRGSGAGVEFDPDRFAR